MTNMEYTRAGQRMAARTLMKNVYLWMTAGLSITAVVAWWTVQTPAVLRFLFGNGPFMFFGLVIAEFALVFYLSSRIMTMSTRAAIGSFVAYSALNGLTLSVIFLAYTGTSVLQAFVSAAAMFAVMSLWAISTKKDLSGWGHYLFMGLIGLLVAGFIGMFFGGGGMLYSLGGAVLFTLLTAYDTQMIYRMSNSVGASAGEENFLRMSILGALKLYLDFINMFLFLLRLFGRRN